MSSISSGSVTVMNRPAARTIGLMSGWSHCQETRSEVPSVSPTYRPPYAEIPATTNTATLISASSTESGSPVPLTYWTKTSRVLR